MPEELVYIRRERRRLYNVIQRCSRRLKGGFDVLAYLSNLGTHVARPYIASERIPRELTRYKNHSLRALNSHDVVVKVVPIYYALH